MGELASSLTGTPRRRSSTAFAALPCPWRSSRARSPLRWRADVTHRGGSVDVAVAVLPGGQGLALGRGEHRRLVGRRPLAAGVVGPQGGPLADRRADAGHVLLGQR